MRRYRRCDHSYRKACTGSSFAAREAGYIPETRLTTIENEIAPATSHHDPRASTDQIREDSSFIAHHGALRDANHQIGPGRT